MAEKRKKERKKGLSILEVLLAFSLIAFSMLGFLYAYRISLTDQARKEIVAKLLFDISRIELAFLHYYNARNEYPEPDRDPNNRDRENILTNRDLNKYFLREPMPKVPETFNSTYGRNGYRLSNNTQGYFLCLQVTVTGPNDVRFLALKEIANNFPGKAFYHKDCPSTANTNDPTKNETLHLTYWIIRQ